MIMDITNGQVIIDEASLPIFNMFRWHVGDNGYAIWRGILDGRKQTIRLHRLLTQCPKDKVVDHINHNKLDNRLINLRVCTQSDNLRNKSDQGKGYWFQKQNRNWVVEVYGKHRGTFQTEAEASEFAKQVRAGLVDMKPRIEPVICRNGHSLDNAYRYSGYGKRCRVCQSNRSKKYYIKKKQRSIS